MPKPSRISRRTISTTTAKRTRRSEIGVAKIKRYFFEHPIRGADFEDFFRHLSKVAACGLSSDDTPDHTVDFDERDILPASLALERLHRENTGQRVTWEMMQAAIDSSRRTKV
jgi:hypothetical protein